MTLEEAREFFINDRFAMVNGMTIDELDDDRCVCSMELTPDHRNAVGGIMGGDFGLFYQVPRDSGALYEVTDVISTYTYRGLQNGNMSQTAAVGLFQSLVGLVLVLVTNGIVKKINNENAMF